MDGLYLGVGHRRCNNPFWAPREVDVGVTESNPRKPFSSYPSATS